MRKTFKVAFKTLALSTTVTQIAIAAPDFKSPIDGTAYKDWTIVNYVDHDPTSGYRDYRGGLYSYDGHQGIDLALANFAAMDRGVSVLAAARGTVVATHDGEYDRCSWLVYCGNNPNYISIDHGDGYISHYYHLKKNSIDVAVGDKVEAGDVIGLVGSSGISTDAHLHFEVHLNGDVVDTQIDPTNNLYVPIDYAGNHTGVLDHGITSIAPTLSTVLDRPLDDRSFDQSAGQQVHFWTRLFGIHPADRFDFKWYSPSGNLFTNYFWTGQEIRYGWWYGTLYLPNSPETGDWSVTFSVNGNILANDRFAVSVPDVPSIYLCGFGVAVILLRRRFSLQRRIDA